MARFWTRWFTRKPGAPVALRRFDGAAIDRLTASWNAWNVALDDDLRTSLDRLRARSRDQFRNNEYAIKFGKLVRNNVVGADGFKLQAQIKRSRGAIDSDANEAIESVFEDWARPQNCDVRGQRSLTGLCQAAALALARDGEFLVRKRMGAAAGAYGYQLQMLDVDRLDTGYNQSPANGRNAVIMGVEVDAWRKPVAYHLWTRHPAEAAGAATRYRERVPAGDILHGFIPIEDEQARGVPWLHGVLRRIHDLDGYRSAAVTAARVGACKMGLFVSPDGQPGLPADGTSDRGDFLHDAEPGSFDVVPAGYDFKNYDPTYPHEQFEAFCKAALRGIASGVGVSYHALANDLEGVNFSSIRSGTLEEREEWKAIQQWLVDALLEPIYHEWLERQLVSGRIKLPHNTQLSADTLARYRAHIWQPRRWQWVDPLKDMTASVLAIDNGLASPQQIAAQAGQDIEDIINDLAEFRQLLAAKGVQLNKSTLTAGVVAAAATAEAADTQTAGNASS